MSTRCYDTDLKDAACAWLDRPVPARQSSPATATSKKAWASHGLDRARGLPRSSLAPPSASLEEKLPYPALLFDGQLKTRQAPGTSSLALPHPRPGRSQETCPGPRRPPDPQKLPFPKGREDHHRPPTAISSATYPLWQP
jgi:hypothetical protein